MARFCVSGLDMEFGEDLASKPGKVPTGRVELAALRAVLGLLQEVQDGEVDL